MYIRRLIVLVTRLLSVVVLIAATPWLATSKEGACCATASAPATIAPLGQPGLGRRPNVSPPPQLAIEPYVRPELNVRMRELRPTIMAAAARHNIPSMSGMSDREFAEVIALVMYNEHNGWLEDGIEPLRIFTPLYEDLQQRTNSSGIGSDFSIWPANLRPSVALEILRRQVPVPGPTRVLTVPVEIYGSRIVPERYSAESDLLAAISIEISDDTLAVEYLAANLARGLYRAQYEGVQVSWRTLAAWHNQGIVDPAHIRENSTANDYVRRASAYVPTARRLIEGVQQHKATEAHQPAAGNFTGAEIGMPDRCLRSRCSTR